MSDELSPALSLVLTTAPSSAVGESLARTLVEERLVACANVIPGIDSVYRWNGEVTTEKEALVVLKTAVPRVDLLFARITELHPYAIPELIAVPVAAASHAYSRWVRHETIEVNA